jgi:hypothetical protein
MSLIPQDEYVPNPETESGTFHHPIFWSNQLARHIQLADEEMAAFSNTMFTVSSSVDAISRTSGIFADAAHVSDAKSYQVIYNLHGAPLELSSFKIEEIPTGQSPALTGDEFKDILKESIRIFCEDHPQNNFGFTPVVLGINKLLGLGYESGHVELDDANGRLSVVLYATTYQVTCCLNRDLIDVYFKG